MLAEQYYCEKKVEMALLQGKEETLEMKLGKEAHEHLLKGTTVVEREQLLNKIYSGKPVLVREMLLIGKHKDVVIIGLADAVCFYQKRPVFLFEYKFSSRLRPFREHHVQAKLYCYLLHLMGWNTNKLKYAIVVASPKLMNNEKLRTISTLALLLKIKDTTISVMEGEVKISIYKFKVEEAVSELEWALGFWKKEREAIPTRKHTKCETCEYKTICSFSKIAQEF
ncbi:MAG: PD-(D/E)XK nuclease family protein [Thermoproteota archaeon]